MKNKLSFSSSPLTKITNSKYYDLDETLNVMLKLWNFSIIQGFEFQHLAEWNKRHSPQDTDPRYDRLNTWNDSLKYTVKEISNRLKHLNVPVLSIHGNRDIGILLSSDINKDVENGKKLIRDSVNLAKNVNAKICVFHIWNTKSHSFNLSVLKKTIHSISKDHPNILLSVENIPTSIPNSSPFDLIKDFDYITMDLRWCAVYDELKKFSKLKDKIINVHIRGELEGCEWKLKNAPFTVEEALDIILKQWSYKGILTFEPEGGLVGEKWEKLTKALGSISSRY